MFTRATAVALYQPQWYRAGAWPGENLVATGWYPGGGGKRQGAPEGPAGWLWPASGG